LREKRELQLSSAVPVPPPPPVDNVRSEAAAPSKMLMAWYVCCRPSKISDHVRIGDERSFGEALEFAAWCVVATFAVAALIAGDKASGETAFHWQEVASSGLFLNGLILYPFLRLFAGKQLAFQSFVHVYCYVLTLGVLKLVVTFYIGKFITIAVIFGLLFGFWEIGILAYLLKRILNVGYWKFAAGFVLSAIVIGIGMAVFRPDYLHSLAPGSPK